MATARADNTPDLADRRDRLLLILRFMSDVSPSPLLEHVRDVVHSAFERKVSTPVQNPTVPPVENPTDRRGDEPQIVAAS